MSEYQYYEFQTIDRPLTAAQQALIRQLSSRVELTATRAAFTYSHGGFRGEPLDVLKEHFDAFFYIANWGSKQLAFRFLKQTIDQNALQPYYYGVEEIEMTTAGEYLILNIAFHEEEGYGWIDGEGLLDPLIPLRDAILRGDLRALYLIWLRSAANMEEDTATEPPVPPGLGQLDPALQALMALFAIDQDLVAAAAEASPSLKQTDEPLERWIAQLPEHERNSFLLRVARGEPQVGIELLRRLRQIGGGHGQAQASTAARRTFAELCIAAEQQQQQRIQRERIEAEQARLAKLASLAQREEQIWASINGLLAQRNASGYEQSVTHLTELRELALHRGRLATFDARLTSATSPYANSTALFRRLKEHGLV